MYMYTNSCTQLFSVSDLVCILLFIVYGTIHIDLDLWEESLFLFNFVSLALDLIGFR